MVAVRYFEGIALLLTAGLYDSEHRLDEATAICALSTKGQLAPDHGMAQGTLTGVVGGFDPLMTDQHPEPLTMLVQLLAHTHERRVASLDTAQQQTLHLAADRGHATDKSSTTDRAMATVAPVLEQFVGHPAEVISEAFGLIVSAVNQSLKITLQMNPAPLDASCSPMHRGPVTSHNAAERIGHQLINRGRSAGRTYGEHGEHASHRGRRPSLRVFFSLVPVSSALRCSWVWSEPTNSS